MKHYSKYFSIGFIALIMTLPLISSAQTTDETQAKIQALLAQIKTLQEQLRALSGQSSGTAKNNTTEGMMGTSTPPLCPQIGRTLSVGTRGDDVKELQTQLASDSSVFSGSATGYFDKETAKGVAKYQEKNGISKTGTGVVGNLTREFIAKKCPALQGPIGGTVTANDGITLSFSNKEGIVKSVTITAETKFLKWTATTTPPTSGSSSDASIGSKVIIEATTQANTATAIARVVRIGFPLPSPMMEMKDGTRTGMMGTSTPGRGDDRRPPQMGTSTSSRPNMGENRDGMNRIPEYRDANMMGR